MMLERQGENGTPEFYAVEGKNFNVGPNLKLK